MGCEVEAEVVIVVVVVAEDEVGERQSQLDSEFHGRRSSKGQGPTITLSTTLIWLS